ncbi:amidohydrolase family protein [Streptomyces sp. NPDC056716]|uniref:N-acyl-D-amino-acid deacylase family protein n=1 Tax=unclassified Streptomyces TaxID=2593676 RepID=UPI0036ABE9C8
MTFDLLLRRARVLDGTGRPEQALDIGITGDTITYAGPPLTPPDAPDADRLARHTLDLDGLVLTPGFIDIHTHSDVSLLHDPAGESKVLQGVTTEVVGNCGFSAFPSHPAHRATLTDHLARLGDRPTTITWDDLTGYAAALRAHPPALNVAALVGHSALRIAAMTDPYATTAQAPQVRIMRRLLHDALDQGAFGMSTGLTHTPSSLADSAEIEALAEVCARHDALYATHARAGAGREFAAVDEAVACARATGVRTQYSHLALNEPANWGRAPEMLGLFEAAVASGTDLAFDVYPYDASSSALVQYLPAWVQAGGSDALREHSTDPAWRRRALADIRKGWFGGIPWLWDRVVISAAGGETAVVGRSVAEIADTRGTPPEVVVLDLCAEFGSAAQAVLHYRTDADMSTFLAHPLSVVGSDGNALPLAPAGDTPHPRGFGTFPRVLGGYVRDTGRLTLADAVHKMTVAPARRLGLRGRGEIRAGYVADLVAFDSRTVADRATFADPRRAPVGIRRVLVAGRTVVADGRLTDHRPGRFLHHD